MSIIDQPLRYLQLYCMRWFYPSLAQQSTCRAQGSTARRQHSADFQPGGHEAWTSVTVKLMLHWTKAHKSVHHKDQQKKSLLYRAYKNHSNKMYNQIWGKQDVLTWVSTFLTDGQSTSHAAKSDINVQSSWQLRWLDVSPLSNPSLGKVEATPVDSCEPAPSVATDFLNSPSSAQLLLVP